MPLSWLSSRQQRCFPLFIASYSQSFKTMTPTLTYYDIAPDVLSFSTTRHGGCSSGLYGEFNINRYCGDDETAVERNLELLGKELGVETGRIIMPHQTHGVETRQIAADFLSLSAEVRQMVLEGVDALMTDEKGICIGVSTADCIPMLLYDTAKKAIAAIHAGWRGTLQGIARRTIEAMKLAYGTAPADLKAVIGPGISMEAFEVGDEVYGQFADAGVDMERVACWKGKWHIDLPLCNRLQLTACGVKEENITLTGICTFNNADDYFSARRLGINSGRIYTAAMLK